MPVLISMLRGVNVGGHHRIKMAELCAIYASLKLADARHYLQSGNVIFRSGAGEASRLCRKIADAVERKVGFRCDVILRTTEELRATVKKNPFAKRGLDPAKLLVDFLAAEPGSGAQAALAGVKRDKEEMHLIGRELYIYFPEGAGRSKLQWGAVEKKLGTTGTARNWNTITELLAMAEEMEG
jgi:uncharacterized protein (DUF1697 family)